jgi:hypothetical protein
MRPWRRAGDAVRARSALGAIIMRAAASIAASIVAIGVYLAIAAAFSFSPTVIGLGILAIAAIAAVVMTIGPSTASVEPVA